MDPLTSAAASGLRARMQGLDMLANNIANASSVGFKADLEFYSLYHGEQSAESGNPDPTESPVIEKSWTDFSQGQIAQTNGELDVALLGEGFFTIQTPSGPLYTRDGSFRLSAKGILQTTDGYPVLGIDDKPIQLDVTQPVDVDAEGRIEQRGADAGQLKIVRFTAPQVLSKQDRAYFRLSVSDLKPVPATGVQVQQRSLESANVQPAQAAVRLVGVMRQFEMLQRAMTIGNEMSKHAVEDVARVE